MLVKIFKNGNINVKIVSDDFDFENPFIELINTLLDHGYTLLGEEYCINNWEMGFDMYSYYSDKVVEIPYRILSDLIAKKNVKLYARELTDYDVELLNKL